MNKAIGMVAKTVNVDQALCVMALTTTSASTAIRMIMMQSVPIIAAVAPKRPSSSRARCARLRPSRRVEQKRTSMSCTQPASTAPTSSHSVPGR